MVPISGLLQLCLGQIRGQNGLSDRTSTGRHSRCPDRIPMILGGSDVPRRHTNSWCGRQRGGTPSCCPNFRSPVGPPQTPPRIAKIATSDRRFHTKSATPPHVGHTTVQGARVARTESLRPPDCGHTARTLGVGQLRPISALAVFGPTPEIGVGGVSKVITQLSARDNRWVRTPSTRATRPSHPPRASWGRVTRYHELRPISALASGTGYKI